MPVEGHSVVQILVEMRLFLEKIRPIDKKMEYQIQKLTREQHIKVTMMGIYRPPKFMPASMDKDKRRKQASRRDKALARMATENPYIKKMMDDAVDRLEEWKETVDNESREFTKYMRQREELEKQEEEHFTHAPITRHGKQIERQMRRKMNGLQGIFDVVSFRNSLYNEEREDNGGSSQLYGGNGARRKYQKNKRKRH